MPPFPYLVIGSPNNSFDQPDFSVIDGPPTIQVDNNLLPLEAHINEFIANLHNLQLNITATMKAAICLEIQNQLRVRLFGANATNPLSVGNRIVDVYVNDSRESGDQEMWRSTGANTYAIHPMTNNYVLQGPINIGVAQHPDLIQSPQFWVYADVIAKKL